MSKFIIQVHAGFMIKEYVEKFQNVAITKNVNEAMRFDDKKAAEDFVKFHDGKDHGFSKRGSKIIEV